MVLEGIIKGLEVLTDVVEHGPVTATKIHTNFSPDYARSVVEMNKEVFPDTTVKDKLASIVRPVDYLKIPTHTAVSTEDSTKTNPKGTKPASKIDDKFVDSMINIIRIGAKVGPIVIPAAAAGIKSVTQNKAVKKEDKKNELVRVSEQDAEVIQPAHEVSTGVSRIIDGSRVIADKEFRFDDIDINNNIAAALHQFEVGQGAGLKILKCAIFSFLFMSKIVDREKLWNSCEDVDERLMLNSMVEMFTGEKMYPEIEAINLKGAITEEMAENFSSVSEWEYDYLLERIPSKNQFQMVSATYKGILKTISEIKGMIEEDENRRRIVTSQGKKVEDDIEPIEELNPNLTTLTVGYTDEEKKKIISELEVAMKESLKPYKHHEFNFIGEMVELVIVNEEMTGFRRFSIDPGTCIGNGYNIIGNRIVDNSIYPIYVPVKYVEIVKNILADKGNSYFLSPKEIQKCLNNQFLNQNIYYFVDMRGFAPFIDKLSQKNRLILGKKLSAVTNIEWSTKFVPCRLRLLEWHGVNKFSLISDHECRSPLSTGDYTCGRITPGFKINILQDKLTVLMKDPGSSEDRIVEIYNIVDR